MDRFMQVCPRISLETVKSCKKLAISDYTFELTFSSRSESRAMNYVTKRDGSRKRSLQDMFIESQYKRSQNARHIMFIERVSSSVWKFA